MKILVDTPSPLFEILNLLISRLGHIVINLPETELPELIVQFISRSEFENDKLKRYPSQGTVCKWRVSYAESLSPNQQSFFNNKPILYITDFVVDSEDAPAESKFLDSSIWHRAVPLDDPETPFFYYNLCQRLADFQHWVADGLHKTIVALEMLDFHLKQIRNLYLEKIEGDDKQAKPRGHYHVNLVPFQSETAMWKGHTMLAAKGGLPKHNLRCLMLDDYATRPLRFLEETNGENEGNGEGKSTVLNDDLNHFVPRSKAYQIGRCVFRSSQSPLEFGLELDTVETIKEAIDKLDDKKGMYDLIFLDFLLGYSAEKMRRQTGVYFIEELVSKVEDREKYEIANNKGPLGKFWIFPISAFSAAMTSAVTKGDLLNFNPVYNLASGADPICTPELFRFKLLSFLRAQYSSFSEVVVLKGKDKGVFSALEQIHKNELAVHCHTVITQKQQQIALLLDESARGSLLAREVFKDAPVFEGIDGNFFQDILPYFENFLRMYAYHKEHSIEPMLQDLEVMRLKAQQYSTNDNLRSFIKWLREQKEELLKLLS